MNFSKLKFWQRDQREEAREALLLAKRDMLLEEYALEAGQLRTQWPKYGKLGKANIKVLVTSEERDYLVKGKIKDEYWLEFKVMGRKRKVLIVRPPKILEAGIFFFGFLPKQRRCLEFAVGWNAECTHDAHASSLNIDAISHAMHLSKVTANSGAFEAMAKSTKKSVFWTEIVPWIAVTLIVLGMSYFFSGGNPTSPGY